MGKNYITPRSGIILFMALVLSFINNASVAQVPEEYYQNFESVPQKTDERTGLQDTLISLGHTINLEDINLFEFAFLAADSNGNLAGFDFSANKIVYFPHTNLSNIRFLGNGRGRGPKEFRNPYDVAFDSSGNIWLVDVDAARITQWSASGKLLKTLAPNKKYARPARFALCSDNRAYIISDQYNKEGIIQVISTKGRGEFINAFQQIKNPKERFPAYTEGEGICYNDKLYYAGKFKNYIRKYDMNGKILFSRSVQAFEPNEEPMVKRDGRFFMRSENARRASGDLAIRGNNLWVGFSGKKDEWLRYLDVYNSDTGDYIRSYVFKSPVKEFAFSGKTLYVIEWDYANKTQKLALYRFPVIKDSVSN